MTPRGQVELICLGEELDRPCKRRVQRAQEGADDSQRGEKFVAVACAAGQLRSLRLSFVFVQAIDIIVGDDGRIEERLRRQEFDELPWLLRPGPR